MTRTSESLSRRIHHYSRCAVPTRILPCLVELGFILLSFIQPETWVAMETVKGGYPKKMSQFHSKIL